uniref:Uncharacterized protein n=1 Tax=Panstrongylus lignarius TaxID=156445 RepID=A0A224Y5F8_9HEMI
MPRMFSLIDFYLYLIIFMKLDALRARSADLLFFLCLSVVKLTTYPIIGAYHVLIRLLKFSLVYFCRD